MLGRIPLLQDSLGCPQQQNNHTAFLCISPKGLVISLAQILLEFVFVNFGKLYLTVVAVTLPHC